MTISIIAAVSSNSALGYKGELLFNIKEDMKHFQKETMGNVVVFGRKSFEEIVRIHGKGLSGRVNVVLTRDESYEPKHGEIVFNDIEKIINHHKTNNVDDKKIMICGGSSVYSSFLPYADEIILTHINKHVEEADTFYDLDLQESLGFCPVEESEELYSEKYDAYFKFVRYKKEELASNISSDNK